MNASPSRCLGALLLFFASVSLTSLAQQPLAKHPKLSTPLAELARTVPQGSGSPAPGARVTAPPGFSVDQLPKSLRDRARAGTMHVSSNAEVQVYIETAAITQAELQQLRGLGVTIQILGRPQPDKGKGEVLSRVPIVQALVPAAMIQQVAALPFVRYLRLPDYGHGNTGSVDSEGDTILNADQARSIYGLSGAGVRVGVISDGIGGVFATGCSTCGPATVTPSPIQTGDLPSATGTRNGGGILTAASGGITARSFRADGNLEACIGACDTSSGTGAEGTAMLEIIHDLAPSATLYFANFDTGLAFEQAVDWMDANADVAVDDISFLAPPFDGTNPISTNTAMSLNTDSNPVRAYFTAVGNMAFSHWGEAWTDFGQNLTLACPNGNSSSGDVQLFQATANTADQGNLGPRPWNPVSLSNGGTVDVFLAWNDPFAASTNDYDLFLYLVQNGSLTTPLACSANPQTGTQPPLERVTYTNNSGGTQEIAIVIQNVNNAAAARNFDLFALGSGASAVNPDFYTRAGSVPAEGDAGGSPVSVVSVGATNAQIDNSGNPPASVVEPYSSQGPTEATPQAAGRIKPDLVAPDNVSVTGAGGFGYSPATGAFPCPSGTTPCNFAGTSAAAPHAAAVAALLLQSAPCLLSASTVNTPAAARARLRSLLTGNTSSLPGLWPQLLPNNGEGFGLLNAQTAVVNTLPSAFPNPSQTVSATSANGAAVTLSGSGSDPDGCPVTLIWSGDCGSAVGASPTLNCGFGVNTVLVRASNGGATQRTITILITVSDFAISAGASTATVSPGQAATYVLSLSSRIGAFTNPVSLSCSGLPASASCAFSPPSIAPGAAASVTLTVSTSAAPVASLRRKPFPRTPAPVYAFWFVLPGIALVAPASRRRKRTVLSVLLAIFVVSLLSMYAGCGGTRGPAAAASASTAVQQATPSGTYTITVTGSSNSLQHSARVTLTVH